MLLFAVHFSMLFNALWVATTTNKNDLNVLNEI